MKCSIHDAQPAVPPKLYNPTLQVLIVPALNNLFKNKLAQSIMTMCFLPSPWEMWIHLTRLPRQTFFSTRSSEHSTVFSAVPLPGPRRLVSMFASCPVFCTIDYLLPVGTTAVIHWVASSWNSDKVSHGKPDQAFTALNICFKNVHIIKKTLH